MAMAKESMAKSLSEFANALESEEVEPRILGEVGIFIRKFPLTEVLTCPEDNLTKCPPEILDEILQYPVPEPHGLEVGCYGEQ